MGHGLRAALGHENRRASAWTLRNTTQEAGSPGGDGGGAVPLTNIEYRLLSELSVNAGRALTNPASIFAVPRVGYRMEKGEEQEGA